MSASSLACRGLVVRHGGTTILNHVDVQLRAGELVSLLGVNGAGKSTLLRALLGLIAPVAGDVTLNDVPLHRHKRREIAKHIAWVPQHHAPQFPYTVEQIVALGRLPHAELLRSPRAVDRAAIDDALNAMQVAHLAHRDYGTLSGGERQRVMLARALAQGARILLLDEPFAGLDFGQHLRLLQLLTNLAAKGYAILHTHHRPDDAFNVSTRVVLLANGRIAADGAPRDVLHEAAVSTLYRADIAQIDIDGQRFFRTPPFSRM
jgi:iron complex transport system ATP-binding protein